MPDPATETFLKDLLSQTLGRPVPSFTLQPIGGGSINSTYRLIAGDHPFFLKINKAGRYPGLFEKEKEGLEFLASHNCIRIPRVAFCGVHKEEQLLLLEWIEPGTKTGIFWESFGERLASLHQCSQPLFGFVAANYMGALPQQNNFNERWPAFFADCRIRPQVDLAVSKNLLLSRHVDLFQQLCKKLDTIFNTEAPSLLHGDLWSGNFLCDTGSQPVLIDPAVYYGHRSMDLAMTTLFGGFDRKFYAAYHYHAPLPANHAEQWDICNLYPLLIHLNLFGTGYLRQIDELLKRYT